MRVAIETVDTHEMFDSFFTSGSRMGVNGLMAHTKISMMRVVIKTDMPHMKSSVMRVVIKTNVTHEKQCDEGMN